MYKAYNYTATYGLMNFEDYPYEYKHDYNKCRFDESKSVFKNVGMVQEKNMDNYDLKARVSKQPVGVGIFTNSKFQFYKDGIMTEEFLECSNPSNTVNHGVALVGYGKTEKGSKDAEWCDEYWVVRNTWGPKWGENGFFKLCMDDAGSDYVPYGICQINRYPTYPTMDNTDLDLELFV